MGNKIGDFIVLLGYGVLLYLAVRPGSQGPSLVTGIGSSTASVVKAVTGGGGW